MKTEWMKSVQACFQEYNKFLGPKEICSLLTSGPHCKVTSYNDVHCRQVTYIQM